MNLNNLKIYCQTEEDQQTMVGVIFEDFPDVKICTWEPDGDDENPGTWGMFVDDFPSETWSKLCEFLESEHSWVLDENVEMALECDEPSQEWKYYP